MSLHLVALFWEFQKTISNTILFKNIQKYSQKIGTILKVSTSSIIWSKPIFDISKFPRSQKILGIQSSHFRLCNFSGLEQETIAWDNFTTIEDEANSSRYDFNGLTTRGDNSSTESLFDAQLGFFKRCFL